MSTTFQLKTMYTQLKAGHRYCLEKTITNLLHQFHPRFLELDAQWVDTLLETEWDLKDEHEWCNLICLIISN